MYNSEGRQAPDDNTFQDDLDYLAMRAKEMVNDGREWFAYEADCVEWTDPRYYHQN